MEPAILVVEDEEKISRLLEIELEIEGYRVTRCKDGMDALALIRSTAFDLILLDIMLPGMSGIEILRRIRANDAITPVIMLTAKDSVEDKVAGLDYGANDYMTKPFQIEELLARIRASLRQRSAAAQNAKEEEEWLDADDLRVNEQTREVLYGRKQLELTPREFDLLVYLLKHKRQVLTRDQIVEAVWGYDYVGETNVVDVYIRYLRKKLDRNGAAELIQTVRGVGYVLKEST